MGSYVLHEPVLVRGAGSLSLASAPRPFKRRCTSHQQEDLLPQFSGLTNDEDREKKAEFRRPGTYNVVVNPTSFAEFEEYTHEERNSLKTSPSKGPGSVNSDHFGIDQTQYNDTYSDYFGNDTSNDPDIVILTIFEDDVRKALSPGGVVAAQRRPPGTPTLSIPSSTSSAQRGEYFRFSYDNTPLMRVAHKDGRDHQLIYYYKNFVHRHLAQVHRDSLGTSLETGALSAPDVFERQAANFLPV